MHQNYVQVRLQLVSTLVWSPGEQKRLAGLLFFIYMAAIFLNVMLRVGNWKCQGR